MGKTTHGMLRTLEENVNHFAGEEIKKKVMEGNEEITEKPTKERQQTGLKERWRD